MASGASSVPIEAAQLALTECSHLSSQHSSSTLLIDVQQPLDGEASDQVHLDPDLSASSQMNELHPNGHLPSDLFERPTLSNTGSTFSTSSISIALSDHSDGNVANSPVSEVSVLSTRSSRTSQSGISIANFWSPTLPRRSPAPKSYIRSNTFANLESKFPSIPPRRDSSTSAHLRQTPSADQLSPRHNHALSSKHAPSQDYFTALDSILANIDSIPVSRERSLSEPFLNTWSYHSSSPIVPITHPKLKRQLAKRNKPVRQVSELFKPLYGCGILEGAEECSTTASSSSSRAHGHQSTSSGDVMTDSVKPKKKKLKSAERPKKEKRKSSDSGAGDASVSDNSYTPRSSSKSKSRSVIRPQKSSTIASSSSSSSLTVTSPEKKRSTTPEEPRASRSRNGTPTISPIGSPISFSPLSSNSVLSNTNAWESALSDSDESLPLSSRSSHSRSSTPLFNASVPFPPSNSLEPKSARSPKSSPGRSRAKSGDSVYFTDTEPIQEKNKRRPSSGLHITDIPLPDLSKRRTKAKAFEIVAPMASSATSPKPRATPSAIWLTNKANLLDATNFFQYLQANLKDSQFCEAVILMHSEVFSSRYLLENLLLLYAQPQSPSSTSSPSSSFVMTSSPSSDASPAAPLSLSSSGHVFPPSAFGTSYESDPESVLKKPSLSSSLPGKTVLSSGESGSGSLTTLRTAIINFLKKWVRLNTQDFTDDSTLQDMFRSFVNDLRRKPGIECQMGGLIWDLFESSLQKLDDDPNILPLSNSDTLLLLGKPVEEEGMASPGGSPRSRSAVKSKPSTPVLNTNGIPNHLLKFTEFPTPYLGRDAVTAMSFNSALGVLDISPIELARQWCLMDHTAFSQVRFRDFLRFAHEPESSESLGRLSSGFNHATSWVAVQILRIDNPKKRARMIAHMISLADELFQLNNYHAFFGVIIGLTQLSIGRLRSTWKQVVKKDLKILSNLQQMASPLSNFAALRQVHDSVPPPFVPLPALFLKDLVMLTESSHEGFINPSTGQVNKEKILIIEKLLGRIHSAQRNHYKFVPIKSIQQLLQQGITITSEELEAWSSRVEPGREL